MKKLNKAKLVRGGKNSVLAIQHLFAMMGATILVPILCNFSIAVGLISAGVGTIIFFFITDKKVPVFLGSSFAFLTAYMLSIPSASEAAIGTNIWNIAMGKVAIAVFCTGIVYCLLALLVKLVGTGFVKKLFPPVVVGPVIIVIGLCLSDVAINNIISSEHPVAYGVTGIITTITIVAASVFAKGFFKVIPVLLGMIVGYITALCFGIVDFSILGDSGWVLFQPTEFNNTFGWYRTFFSKDVWNSSLVGVIFTFVPIAVVTFMEHLGDINASSIVCNEDFINDPGVHKTLLGNGVATIAASTLGGPCNTTYGENTAVLAITKNYNPKLLALAGVFAIVLGIFTKFGAFIGTIPAPVIGGASLVLYGMIAANGLKTLIEARVNFSENKNMIICSLILVIGVGMKVAGVSLDFGSRIVNEATGATAPVISFSPLAVATFVGIFVNALFVLTVKDETLEVEEKQQE